MTNNDFNYYADLVLGNIDLENNMENKEQISISVCFLGSYFSSNITIFIDTRYDMETQVNTWIENNLNEKMVQCWDFN